MTAVLYSPEWRALALAFCADRDAIPYSPRALRSSAAGAAPGSPDASPRHSGPGASYSSSVIGVAGVTEEVMGVAEEGPVTPTEDSVVAP